MGTIQVAGCVLHQQNARLVGGRENGCLALQLRVPFPLRGPCGLPGRDCPGIVGPAGLCERIDTGPVEVADSEMLRRGAGHDEEGNRRPVPGMVPVPVRSTSRVPCFEVGHARRFDRLQFRQNVRSGEHWPVLGCGHVVLGRPVCSHATAGEPPLPR